jgi:type VI secretion system protein ImpL
LLPQLAARIRQRLDDFATEPEQLYHYLKAYVMLGEPKRLDPKYLQELADAEWASTAAAAGQGASVPAHVRSLLEYSDTLRPIAMDATAVARARSTLRPEVIPEILFGQLQRTYAADPRALRIEVIAVGIDKVMRRKSGRPLSQPMPAIYTREVFKEITAPTSLLELTKQFGLEVWVWNPGSLSATTLPKLMAQVSDLYERNYTAAWNEFLNDLSIVPFRTVEQYREALGILGAPTSPLRRVLGLVAEHTSFVQPNTTSPTAPAEPSTFQKGVDAIKNLGKTVTGTSGVPAGTMTSERFQPIHQIMNGSPAPIDTVLDVVRKIRDRLSQVGMQAGGQTPLSALTDQGLFELNGQLRTQSENLPPPVNELVAQIGQLVSASIRTAATGQLNQEYQERVVKPCQARVDGHYPFGHELAPMSLGEFGEVFGYGGLFDLFFKEKLEPLVDTTGRPWRWRQDSVESSTVPLSRFEFAADIRQMFFPEGSKAPKVQFHVTLSDVKNATRFWVHIDGQTQEVLPGKRSRYSPEWPGPKPGVAEAYFEDHAGGALKSKSIGGAWAVFQLIDAGRPDGSSAGALTFTTPYHEAHVTVASASNISNPLLVRDWQKFRCG